MTLAGGVRPGRADAGRRAPGSLQGRRPLLGEELARRALQHGALEEGQRERRLQPSGHRLHLGQQRRHRARHLPDRGLRPVPQRSARPVLALHRSARREVRLRVDPARRLRDHRRLRLRDVGRAARGDLRHLGHDVAVDGQPLDQDRRVVHLRRDRAVVSAAAERRLPLHRRARRRRRTPFQFQQSFALVPEARADVPEGLRDRRLLPGRLARPQQPDAQPRPALRRRDHQGHPRLAGAAPTRTTSIRASASRGIRRAIRNGRSAAASDASRSSMRSSRSSRAASAAATAR